MFELSVAFKYLVPRWRQLSVSIISLISIVVIALVVWLIVVFFSVTHGLEKSWIQKLIALTAPVRVSPTEHYYDSYYYLVDSVSMDANYTPKTIGEKLSARKSDPYNPDFDQEIPAHWPLPDKDQTGQLRDPVKQAFEAVRKMEDVPGIGASEYEMTVTNVKLDLIRNHGQKIAFTGDPEADQGHASISQPSYLGSYDPDNPNLVKAMLPVTKEDVRNLIAMTEVDRETPTPYGTEGTGTSRTGERLKKIFSRLQFERMVTGQDGAQITKGFFPDSCKLQACALKVGKRTRSVFLPSDSESLANYQNRPFNERVKPLPATLEIRGGKGFLSFEDGTEEPLEEDTPLIVDSGVSVRASLDSNSLDNAHKPGDLELDSVFTLQGVQLSGKTRWDQMEVASFQVTDSGSDDFWLFNQSIPQSLPSDSIIGDAILLPKSFRAAGALIGDRGFLSYQTATATSVQEQRVPVYVAGFYDPGILPFGGKIVLANQYITSMIRSSYPNDKSPLSNGINVRFDHLDDAELVKKKLQKAFKEAGIESYWHIETFREFDFTKDFLQQLRSERNLFSIISTIIIIVACANIISMLIILVNNKKMEIGILRSMGASSSSVAFIFGTCGIVMGVAGSAIGLIAAVFTLRNLQVLIDLISRLQGFDAFNPIYYGDTLPNEVSFEALAFVMAATTVTSLIAGIIPAVKACLMRPSAILRAE